LIIIRDSGNSRFFWLKVKYSKREAYELSYYFSLKLQIRLISSLDKRLSIIDLCIFRRQVSSFLISPCFFFNSSLLEFFVVIS
jgi:hypothetical protein